MENIYEILEGVTEPPDSFEQYLVNYAEKSGRAHQRVYSPRNASGYEPVSLRSAAFLQRQRRKTPSSLISFAACIAVGGDVQRALSAAAAIEHFHTAALIHDDIADEAELAVGEPLPSSHRGDSVLPSTWATSRFRWSTARWSTTIFSTTSRRSASSPS